ncbi:MAG: DJ-1/PfpI family protein [Oscillospiraceae bacterium]|nr:DJ-1/PfpI family protein [Oscillospiraceae bacterium]
MIYIFLADGFEETEAIAPIDMLRRAGVDVVTVGIKNDAVKSSHGVPVLCDITDMQVELDDRLEMIILPGGMPGTLNIEANPVVQQSIDYCVEHNIPVGAICAAPSILGKKGLLDGSEAICFPGFEKFLTGAKLSDKKVVTDGIFTTAAGAGVAVEFGLRLVEVLCGKEKSESVRKAIQCAN